MDIEIEGRLKVAGYRGETQPKLEVCTDLWGIHFPRLNYTPADSLSVTYLDGVGKTAQKMPSCNNVKKEGKQQPFHRAGTSLHTHTNTSLLLVNQTPI